MNTINSMSAVIKQSILAAAIALIIPCMLYWGIQSVYRNPGATDLVYTGDTPDAAQTDHHTSSTKPLNAEQFWVFTVSALLLLIAGSRITIFSVSSGLMGAGLLNMIFGLANTVYHPLYNFLILLILLFGVLIAATTSHNTHK